MGRDGKTDLQRDILLTWYDHPGATNKEIAEACDCSASYVSQIKNRFDDYNQFEAMMDRQDREMEQMFGDDIFAAGGSMAAPQGVNLPEAWEETPNNPAGLVIKGIILLVLLYVFWEIVQVLVF